MGNSEEKLFTIGDLAKKAGVTVRTLQFYDRSGLLKSTLSAGGRRMFNRDGVLRLSQILFLKSFGFSLEEIRDRLLPQKSAEELETIFTQQKNVLRAQISQMQKVADMMDKVIDELRAGGEIGIDKLFVMMKLMREGNPYSFILRYLGNDQFKSIINRFENTEQSDEYVKNSEEIFARLFELYKNGADPAGDEGQQFAADWWRMVEDFTAGDKDLLAKLLSAGSDIDNWPEQAKEIQEPIKNFLGSALDVYFKNNGIELPETEGNGNG